MHNSITGKTPACINIGRKTLAKSIGAINYTAFHIKKTSELITGFPWLSQKYPCFYPGFYDKMRQSFFLRRFIMQIQKEAVGFDDFLGDVGMSNLKANPAEVHGVLAGLVCLGHKPEGKSWFDGVMKILEMRVGSVPNHKDLMLGLYDTTCQQLDGYVGEFQLLLPSDKYSFADRAVALSQWCKGFIYGLGVKNRAIEGVSSEECREALRSIAEISNLDFSKIEVSEADKTAYLGVVEYVRMSVITIYEELLGDRDAPSKMLSPKDIH